ncbi:nucleotidyl transferase AbiEii/AbiGii toxin family protein [Candidatus Bipolaricaulota bacterium]|nr:nucleotidyl transferase AbiEii/AbiGii toxin family protein [Candidatus Bipolaricaulota bacterium]
MIPRDFITEWRMMAPWTQELQIEQDLIITRAMVEMFSQAEVGRTLATRGGTALYKLHLRPAARYSEDIDLVQVSAEPIGRVLDAVRTVLDPWLNTPKRTLKEGSVTLVYRMTSEGPPALPMRLKVEINSREHFTVFGIEERVLEMHSRWFSGTAVVKTYTLEELFGTKLRALYQRKKGRDLFDLWYGSRRAVVDEARVIQCFQRYMAHDGISITRAEFEKNLHDKLTDPTFAADIETLLASGIEWDFKIAADYVHRKLVARLPGKPWKGSK